MACVNMGIWGFGSQLSPGHQERVRLKPTARKSSTQDVKSCTLSKSGHFTHSGTFRSENNPRQGDTDLILQTRN